MFDEQQSFCMISISCLPPLPRRRGDYYIEEYIALCQLIDDFCLTSDEMSFPSYVIASDETSRSLKRGLGLFPDLAHNLTSRLGLVDETNAGSRPGVNDLGSILL